MDNSFFISYQDCHKDHSNFVEQALVMFRTIYSAEHVKKKCTARWFVATNNITISSEIFFSGIDNNEQFIIIVAPSVHLSLSLGNICMSNMHLDIVQLEESVLEVEQHIVHKKSLFICSIHVLLGRYAKNRWFAWSADVLSAQIYSAFYLLGDYAETFMRTNFISQVSSVATWITHQYHYAAHTTSSLVTKGIATNQSSIILEGTIVIFPEADGVNASLEHGVLRHSIPALVLSKPILEISHNDVRCSHGSAIGDVDESSLFYLRSRGFTYSRAHMMLMYAFIAAGGFVEQKIAGINLLTYE